jgi:hypothetical protein
MTLDGKSKPEMRTTKRVCRRLSDFEVAELLAGDAAGVPIDQLTAKLKVNQTTVQKFARRNGLPRRSARLGPLQQQEVAPFLSGCTEKGTLSSRSQYASRLAHPPSVAP